jgi:putative endonuclease
MNHYLYILASQTHGTLYIEVTHNIQRRIHEHKNHTLSSFTQKYDVIKLVHVEQYSLMMDAIQREKNLKKWKRDWKIKLIETHNPEWNDLSDALL